MQKFKVEIPGGFLMVEEKGCLGEYPGVFISFSKDGKEFDVSKIIACVEYDESSETIKAEAYGKDNPNEALTRVSYTCSEVLY